MSSRLMLFLASTVTAVGALCALGGAASSGPRPAAFPDRPDAGAVSGGRVFLTVEEALELVFEDCEVERSTEYFNDERKQREEAKNGLESFAYTTRDKFEEYEEQIEAVTTSEQREVIAVCRW